MLWFRVQSRIIDGSPPRGSDDRSRRVDLEQTLQIEMAPRISPKLIASIKILALSSQDLAQTIAQEALENPALDVEEVAQCQTCGERLQDGACPNCAAPTDAPQETTERAEWDFDDL